MDAPEWNFAVKIERNISSSRVQSRRGILGNYLTLERQNDASSSGQFKSHVLARENPRRTLLSMLQDEMPRVQNHRWVDVVIQVVAQGLVDSSTASPCRA